MADTTDTTAPGIKVSIPANSYDFQKLEKALGRAVGLKTEEGRTKAIADALDETAELDAVLVNLRAPAIPEGCELKTITALDGREVEVPVAIPAEDGEEAAAASPEQAPAKAKRAPADPAAD